MGARNIEEKAVPAAQLESTSQATQPRPAWGLPGGHFRCAHSRTSAILGVERSTLDRKIRRYELKPPGAKNGEWKEE